MRLALLVALLCVVEPLPVLPLVVASAPWPAPVNGTFYGDIRAVLQVSAAEAGTEVLAQVFWRRRDPTPAAKGVLLPRADIENVNQTLNQTIRARLRLQLRLDQEQTRSSPTFSQARGSSSHERAPIRVAL